MEAYKADIVRFYHEKKASVPPISPNLIHPTPARLRDECLRKFKRPQGKTDLQAIAAFFELNDDDRSYEAAIRRFDPDKFRPLNNYLKGKLGDTDIRNVELLAWLIDFQPRPYISAIDYERRKKLWDSPERSAQPSGAVHTEEWEKEISPTSDGGNVIISDPPEARPKWFMKIPKRIAAIVIFAIPCLIGYIMWKESRLFSSALSGQCMYWAADHYQPVACDQAVPNAILLPLNEELITSKKKVSDLGTITKSTFEAYWYSKIHGKVEFFTAGGEHPVDTGKILKPMTRYMFEKYIVKRAPTEKNDAPGQIAEYSSAGSPSSLH